MTTSWAKTKVSRFNSRRVEGGPELAFAVRCFSSFLFYFPGQWGEAVWKQKHVLKLPAPETEEALSTPTFLWQNRLIFLAHWQHLHPIWNMMTPCSSPRSQAGTWMYMRRRKTEHEVWRKDKTGTFYFYWTLSKWIERSAVVASRESVLRCPPTGTIGRRSIISTTTKRGGGSIKQESKTRKCSKIVPF